MTKNLHWILSFMLLATCMRPVSASAQQTVGLFKFDSAAFEGYTLLAPIPYETVFLLDMCGREVHRWEDVYKPGMEVILLEDGTLLRTGRLTSAYYGGGGIGGQISKVDWDGTLLWTWQYADSTHHQHHDIEPLPSGNILLLAWERRTNAEAIAAGRNPATMPGEMWPDHVVEIMPIGSDSAVVVWEWHTWDHLIQDFDSTKPNYGVVSEHPELMDINYPVSGVPDWSHCNAVDYNEALDQIVISSHNQNELWIIDHSTTTAEAAGHTGGKYGKGGDFLYRWGNPRAYKRGGLPQQRLFGQHDTRWIPDGYPGAGNIMIFNNGVSRPAGDFSSIDEITPPMDSMGYYTIPLTGPIGPTFLSWTYQAPVPTDFYSNNISGAERLMNGNTFIDEGAPGHLFEVTDSDSIVWDYVNPITISGPLTQGSPAIGNMVFRAHRYPLDFPGFAGRDLTPGDRLELSPLPLPANCLASGIKNSSSARPWIYPNPASDILFIQTGESLKNAALIDVTGRIVKEFSVNGGRNEINISTLPSGLYTLLLNDEFAGKVSITH